MKLLPLSRTLITTCLLGLLLLMGLAFWGIQQIETKRDELVRLDTIKRNIDAMSVGSDNLLIFQPDDSLLQAFFSDARRIQQSLHSLGTGNLGAQRAIHHIDHLLASLENTFQHGAQTLTLENDQSSNAVPLRSRLIINQIADHGIAMESAIDQLMQEQQQVIKQYINRTMAIFMLSTLLFGGLCIAAFSIIYQRVAGPTRKLINTIERIAHNDDNARAEVVGNDEMAELSSAFNALLDFKQRSNEQIRQQQQELLKQAKLLEIAGRNSRFGGWIMDLVNKRLEWTNVVAEIHGKPADFSPTMEEAVAFYAPEHQQRILQLFTSCAEQGTAYDTELQIINTAGERIWVRSSGEAVRDEAGNIVAIQGSFQDISERIELENRLRQSQRLESVGQLTGGVAHDFNNLLTVVIGNSQIVSEALEPTSRLKPLVDMIMQAGYRGADLTRGLLAFSRKQPLDPKQVDIPALINGLRPLLEHAAGENITVQFMPEPDLHKVLVDQSQLENALLNLTLNAKDAMPDGGRLLIEAQNIELQEKYAQSHEIEAGEYVVIAISDSGVGLDAETLSRVFEPFYTTKPKEKGTGLGLAMVYGFIKQSRGHINIYSEPGNGTTLRLYLPALSKSMETATPLPTDSAPPRTQTGDEHILVVEDNKLILEYVVSQLTAFGYTVSAAGDGDQAMQIIESDQRIDLLLTDVILPKGGNGRQVAEKALKIRPSLRVLYTSGYTENSIVHHGRLDPDVLLLSKPYNREELASKVRQALDIVRKG